MPKHRIAIIGLGMAVTPHAKSLIDLQDRVQVVAAFSPRPPSRTQTPLLGPWSQDTLKTGHTLRGMPRLVQLLFRRSDVCVREFSRGPAAIFE